MIDKRHFIIEESYRDDLEILYQNGFELNIEENKNNKFIMLQNLKYEVFISKSFIGIQSRITQSEIENIIDQGKERLKNINAKQ